MRVVVVGSGVVGLCCAWSLAGDGHDVTVVERGPDSGDKCSVGNAGIVVPSHFIPLAAPGMVGAGLKMLGRRDGPFRIKPSLDPELAKWCLLFTKHCTSEHVERSAALLRDLHLRSRALYLEFAQQFEDFGFDPAGMVMLCQTTQGLEEEFEVADHAEKLGLRVTRYLENQLEDIRSGVRLNASGAVKFMDDCHLSPHVFVRLLQKHLEQKGVTFRWETEVQDVAEKSSLRVKTNTGVLEADALIVAAGTWSGKLMKVLGLNMPLQPGKGMSLFASSGGPLPTVPFLLKEARVAVTPMIGQVRFGGTMELGEWDSAPDQQRLQGMLKSIPDFLPDFTSDRFTSAPVWTGFRPCSPDGLPYIGPTSKMRNVFLASGHGMMGVSLGPITGKLIADALNGKLMSPQLSPDRFD